MRIGVLGAGPAAGTAALHLAQAGGDVTVFRPARPGEKPCGGAVPSFLLGEVPSFDASSIPSVDSPTAVLENSAGETVALDLDGLSIYRRGDFDPALLAAAEEAGARIVASKVRALELRDGEIVASTEERRWVFNWIVGADGAYGLSRRTVGVGPGPMSMGTGASLEGVEASSLVLCFPDLGDAYLWIFPRPGGCSVGVAYTPGVVSKGAAEVVLTEFIGRHLSAPAFRWNGPRYRYPIPVYSGDTLRSAEAALALRILLVGDAVGVADPLTREGIRPAILTGRLAADCLARARPEAYPRQLETCMAAEMERAGRAADLFFEDPIGQWMVPVSRVHPGVRRVLGDLLTCRQPYHGLRRRLLKAAVGVHASAGA